MQRIKLFKFLALGLTNSFFFPSLTFAFTEIHRFPQVVLPLDINRLEIILPKKIARLCASNANSNPMVVIVEDLHCHYEVQKNIKEIIQRLQEHCGLKIVFEEGASSQPDLSWWRDFPDSASMEKIGNYFLRQGRLSGAEYAGIVGQKPLMLLGLENQALYEATIQTARELLTAENQGILLDLKSAVCGATLGLFNSKLQNFLSQQAAYQAGKIDLARYTQWVQKAAAQNEVETPSLLKEYLGAKTREFGHNVDPGDFFAALDKVANNVAETLIQAEDERTVLEVWRILARYEKLANLSATQDEVKAFLHNPNQILDVLHFFQKTGDPFQVDESKIKTILQLITKLYRNIHQRSERFAENISSAMVGDSAKLALAVTGGFHTQDLERALSARGLSYAVVRPRFEHHDLINPYFDILQNKKMPFEELIEKRQTMLGVPTSLNKPSFIIQNIVAAITLSSRNLDFFLAYSKEKGFAVSRLGKILRFDFLGWKVSLFSSSTSANRRDTEINQLEIGDKIIIMGEKKQAQAGVNSEDSEVNPEKTNAARLTGLLCKLLPEKVSFKHFINVTTDQKRNKIQFSASQELIGAWERFGANPTRDQLLSVNEILQVDSAIPVMIKIELLLALMLYALNKALLKVLQNKILAGSPIFSLHPKKWPFQILLGGSLGRFGEAHLDSDFDLAVLWSNETARQDLQMESSLNQALSELGFNNLRLEEYLMDNKLALDPSPAALSYWFGMSPLCGQPGMHAKIIGEPENYDSWQSKDRLKTELESLLDEFTQTQQTERAVKEDLRLFHNL